MRYGKPRIWALGGPNEPHGDNKVYDRRIRCPIGPVVTVFENIPNRETQRRKVDEF